MTIKKEEIRFRVLPNRKEKLDAIAQGMGYASSDFLMQCFDFYLENSHNPNLRQVLMTFQVRKIQENIKG